MYNRYTALVEKNVEQAVRDMQRVLTVSLSQIARGRKRRTNPLPQTLSPPLPRFPPSPRPRPLRLRRRVVPCRRRLLQQQPLPIQDLRPLPPPPPHERLPGGLPRGQAPSRHRRLLHHPRLLRRRLPHRPCRPRHHPTPRLLLFMALSLLSIGFPYRSYWHSTTNLGFMVLYNLTFFFANLGPNTTTFIVPVELFPARLRSTCHGVSGAAGKVGAIVGSVGFLWASASGEGERMTAALVILGGVCVVGMVVTYFFTRETMGRSLEENESEEEVNGGCFLRCISVPCVGT